MDSSEEPFEWIWADIAIGEFKGIPRGARGKVLVVIQRIEDGQWNDLMRKDRIKKLKGHGALWEIRVKDGKRMYRCFFTKISGRRVFIAVAVTKKKANLPTSTLSTYQQRAKDALAELT